MFKSIKLHFDEDTCKEAQKAVQKISAKKEKHISWTKAENALQI